MYVKRREANVIIRRFLFHRSPSSVLIRWCRAISYDVYPALRKTPLCPVSLFLLVPEPLRNAKSGLNVS